MYSVVLTRKKSGSLERIINVTTTVCIFVEILRSMKIEVWSDVVCPFCYVGKKTLEQALNDLGVNADVEWKSFQLDPYVQQVSGKSLHTYLAESKGISIEQARQMGEHVALRGQEVNIDFNFDRAIVAHTEKAHLLLHYAKSVGLQNEVKEFLMHSYFTEGKDLNDTEFLLEAAEVCGLNRAKAGEALESGFGKEAFQKDIQEAGQIGIRGVPFFVFDRKYAISGAQPLETFKSTIRQIAAETGSPVVVSDNIGDSCDVSGENC